MGAQRGKDVLLKLASEELPSTFLTVGGLRTKTIALNAQMVDVSHANSEGWRELLCGAGLSQASISGTGVFLDDTTTTQINTLFFSRSLATWQIIMPSFGCIEGKFLLSNLDYSGGHQGEVTISLALESAGVLTFTKIS